MGIRTIVGAVGILASSAGAQGIAVGQHAPSAAVTTLDGKTTDVRKFVGHTPTVIEFWAKWCGNCRELAPALRAAADKYQGRVTFVTVAVDVDETPDDVRQFAHEHGIAGIVLFDGNGTAVDAYNVPGTSYLVAVDRHGTVVYTGTGPTQDVDAAVRKALE
ncbi:MAG TPA: TlpA disulfide reductase family protein [Gemmatimonadaceae bacterium]|jgi:cytochrome c biogenesis protein CcmG/thiol:disulfide interchange protein DsbE|nr:TlpA disulfide reductase family protein [Gemmatimonadaceae bacterium]